MLWLPLVIISAFASGLTRSIQKFQLSTYQVESSAYSFIFQILVAVVMFVWALISGLNFPDLRTIFLPLLLMGFLYSIGNISLFKAFKRAEVSEVAIIYSLNLVWSVLASLYFLDEILTTQNFVGILLIFLGVVVIQIKKSRWQLSFGHLLAFLASVLHGVAFANDAYILNSFDNVPSYMVIAFLLPGLLTYLFIPNKVENLTKVLTYKNLRLIFLTALIYSVAAVTVFTGYKLGGSASVISPISQMSLLVTVGIGYFVLKERENILNKVFGSLLAIGGVVLLSVQIF